MITTDKDIRIFDDTGKGDTYDINNIIYSDEYVITVKIEHPDFEQPVYACINKHSHKVSCDELPFYLAENYVSKTKQYVLNGGKLFNITSISTIRDGGTKQIITTNKDITLYVHIVDNSLHYSYPPSLENIITSENYIEYIFDRLESYLKNMDDEINRNRGIVSRMRSYEEMKHLPF